MDWEKHEQEIKRLQEVLENTNDPSSEEYKAALYAIIQLCEIQEKSNRLYLDESQQKNESDAKRNETYVDIYRISADLAKVVLYVCGILLLGKWTIYAEEERILNSAAKGLLNFLRPRV